MIAAMHSLDSSTVSIERCVFIVQIFENTLSCNEEIIWELCFFFPVELRSEAVGGGASNHRAKERKAYGLAAGSYRKPPWCNWVEVDDYEKAASGSNVHTGTGEGLHRQQLTQQAGFSSRVGSDALPLTPSP